MASKILAPRNMENKNSPPINGLFGNIPKKESGEFNVPVKKSKIHPRERVDITCMAFVNKTVTVPII